jgi:hypothetical protein
MNTPERFRGFLLGLAIGDAVDGVERFAGETRGWRTNCSGRLRRPLRDAIVRAYCPSTLAGTHTNDGFTVIAAALPKSVA